MPVTYTPKKGLAKPIRDSIPPTKFILKDHLNDNWDRLDNDTADNVAEIITEQWDFQGGALFRGIPWFDVRSYGALADGSDDTAHIQAAIDAAEAAGGGSV
ncbi:MAG: Pectate lyase superfamily protein, partial [Planctomycetota bacterium]|nr:Pectate lyase superfamily protein [Planctomycetota bacterium]